MKYTRSRNSVRTLGSKPTIYSPDEQYLPCIDHGSSQTERYTKAVSRICGYLCEKETDATRSRREMSESATRTRRVHEKRSKNRWWGLERGQSRVRQRQEWSKPVSEVGCVDIEATGEKPTRVRGARESVISRALGPPMAPPTGGRSANQTSL